MEKYLGKGDKKIRKCEVVERTRKNILQRRNTKNIQKSSTKSSSRELIIDFRLKKLHFYRERLAAFQQNTYHDKETLATWLSETKTTVIQKGSTLKMSKTVDKHLV